MGLSELLSNEFIVRWDNDLEGLVIVHPDGERFPGPLMQIRLSMLSEMTFEQASQFIGERLVLLIPALRERYVDSKTGVLREPPKV